MGKVQRLEKYVACARKTTLLNTLCVFESRLVLNKLFVNQSASVSCFSYSICAFIMERDIRMGGKLNAKLVVHSDT
jgi:hypothetical protein